MLLVAPSAPSKPPGKNWPQLFYKRYPELKPSKASALDWNRYDIFDKVIHWFEVIGEVLQDPAVLQENVYNMDETGVMLSKLNSVKVLVSRDNERGYRGARVKRTIVTAVECRANTKPRVLICDGFGTYETLEILEFCFENNIILCRLPSHTSYKLQPCDISVFSPLKVAYREQVERLERGCVGAIGKEHFTYLYSPARDQAFTSRNIRAGWSRAGLFPFNPAKVLSDIPKPLAGLSAPATNEMEGDACMQDQVPQTPVTPITANAVASLHNLIKQDTHVVDEASRQRLQRRIQKLTNATQLSFAERALLEEQNQFFTEINNEAKVRRSTKSIMLETGSARVVSYEHLVEAREDRASKDAEKEARRIASEVKKAAKASRAAEVPTGKKKRGRKRKIDTLEINTPTPKAQAVRKSKGQIAAEVVGVLGVEQVGGPSVEEGELPP
ncbi:hypothetical protein IAQ61_008016 [Plenodomus lingam]|uniref:uncharacterized protein n=1 Tax=Leptosphaeria maculans TaxID=5022 RepID=UPI00333394D5|nr:hypothetical protein IAQ61_008016 [Plenodomus lingam]